MSHNVFYLYSIKGMVNRFKRKPVQLLLIGILLGSAIIIPSFMVRGGFLIEMPQNYIQAFFCFYFAHSFFSIFFKRHAFRTLPQNFISLLTAVPEKTKNICFLLFCDNALKSAASYGAIFWVLSLYMRKGILEMWCQLCLLFLAVIALVAIAEITSYLSIFPLGKGIRILCLMLGITLVLNGILELSGLLDMPEGIELLPQYEYASIVSLILGTSRDLHLLYIWMGGFLLLLLVIFVFLLRHMKLRACHILQKAGMKGEEKTFSIVEQASKAIFFLPVKLKLLIIREVIQIAKEKNPIFNVFWQSMLASAVMLSASLKVEANAIFVGLMVAVSYVGFIIALYSIPRDARTIWIIKTVGIDENIYIMSKFLASYVAAFFLSLLVSVIYLFVGCIFKPEAMSELLAIYLFCIITAMPLSNMLGLAVSSLMPFEMVEKNKKITYKCGGLEGVFLTILTFVGVVPSFVCYKGLREPVIVLAYLLYCLCIGMITTKATKRYLTKMH